MAAGPNSAQLDIADGYALHLLDRVPGLKKTVTQQVAPGFGERDLIPRGILASQPRDFRSGRASECVDFRERQQRFELQVPDLRKMVRPQNAVSEFAVIGQQNQSGGAILHSAGRKDARGNAAQ